MVFDKKSSTSKLKDDRVTDGARPSNSKESGLVSDFQQLGLDDRTTRNDRAVNPAVHAAQAAFVGSIARAQQEDAAQAQAQDDATERDLKDLSSYPAAQIAVQSLQNSESRDNSSSHEAVTDADTAQNRTAPSLAKETSDSQGKQSDSTREISNSQKLASDRPDSGLPLNPDTTTRDMNEPVVHETVKVHNVEIQHEVIERDIHQHHDITKIQPIIEKVAKPARHFVLTEDGRKVEIPAEAAASLETVGVEDAVVPSKTAKTAPT